MGEYTDLINDVNSNLTKFHKEIPDVLSGFSELAKASGKDGVLNQKQKELIALAIGVAKQCDACIGFHTKKLIGLNATLEEINETLGVCVYMGGGPSLMYAAKARKAFEELSKK